MSDRRGGAVFHTDVQIDHSASYPLFDWLRFLLASVVVLGHAGIITTSFAGNLAVQVFFALSGWLIGGILLSSDYRELPRFFFNRATRIWIPYTAAVATVYGLGMMRDGISPRLFEFFFYDMTFTHNWFSLRPTAEIALGQMPLRGTGNHFWSISVEEQFYLAAPLLMLLPMGRKPFFWALAACLLFSLDTGFSSIGLGVLAATVKCRWGDWHRRPFAICALSMVVLVSFIALTSKPLYSLAAPVFSIAVVLLLAQHGQREAWGKFLGGMSYPMYLNHWIGVFGVNALGKLLYVPPAAWGIVAYVGGLAAGAVAYVLIDKPVLAHRQKFYGSDLGLALAAIGYFLVTAGVIFGLSR